LRGGAFGGVATLARCSARDWYLPGGRFGDYGFRVLVSPFSSDL
jgi:formylglycine-generating enzyme required for sulfatase activity